MLFSSDCGAIDQLGDERAALQATLNSVGVARRSGRRVMSFTLRIPSVHRVLNGIDREHDSRPYRRDCTVWVCMIREMHPSSSSVPGRNSSNGVDAMTGSRGDQVAVGQSASQSNPICIRSCPMTAMGSLPWGDVSEMRDADAWGERSGGALDAMGVQTVHPKAASHRTRDVHITKGAGWCRMALQPRSHSHQVSSPTPSVPPSPFRLAVRTATVLPARLPVKPPPVAWS